MKVRGNNFHFKFAVPFHWFKVNTPTSILCSLFYIRLKDELKTFWIDAVQQTFVGCPCLLCYLFKNLGVSQPPTVRGDHKIYLDTSSLSGWDECGWDKTFPCVSELSPGN